MRAVLDRALLMARTRDDYAPRTAVQPNMLTFEDGKNVATVGNCDRYLFSESLTRASQTYISSPTSASWLNMVERFFRDLTTKRIRRGSFRNVPDLEKDINDYISLHNDAPKPFIWTAKADDILEKVKRGRATLNKLQSA